MVIRMVRPFQNAPLAAFPDRPHGLKLHALRIGQGILHQAGIKCPIGPMQMGTLDRMGYLPGCYKFKIFLDGFFLPVRRSAGSNSEYGQKEQKQNQYALLQPVE